MTASQLPNNSTFYLLRIGGGFTNTNKYVVKGTVLTTVSNKTPQVFEVILRNDPDLRGLLGGVLPPNGIVVRVRQVNGEPISVGFMVEISQF